ncbi:MAG TPA: DUF4924 family protein [Bacteroidales bacterium]|nr:DUF4924 family protein [Bacteroidales bacterium]
MIIAREKKKNNIVEYILYMWQIEDMIRASNFDLDVIDQNIIQYFDQPDEGKRKMREWYKDLIARMEKEGIREKGHLGFLKDIVAELEEMHEKLIHDTDELEYINAHNKAKQSINDLKSKSQGTAGGDIEAALQGLYGILLLKLQQKTLNPATQDAQTAISNMMALLNEKYLAKKNVID